MNNKPEYLFVVTYNPDMFIQSITAYENISKIIILPVRYSENRYDSSRRDKKTDNIINFSIYPCDQNFIDAEMK